MNPNQSKSESQSSQNQSNTMNNAQSSENQSNQDQTTNPLAEAFAGFARPEEIAKDLSLLFVFAVGSSGFVELHSDDRQDLAFRTLEYIKSFQMAS